MRQLAPSSSDSSGVGARGSKSPRRFTIGGVRIDEANLFGSCRKLHDAGIYYLPEVRFTPKRLAHRLEQIRGPKLRKVEEA